MQRGKLRAIVRIEAPPTGRDPEYGTPTGDPVVVADLVRADWQDVLPSRGEQIANGLDITLRPARVRMDYREDIRAGMSVVRLDRGDGTDIYDLITEPAELGNREGIEFMVQKYSTRGTA